MIALAPRHAPASPRALVPTLAEKCYTHSSIRFVGTASVRFVTRINLPLGAGIGIYFPLRIRIYFPFMDTIDERARSLWDEHKDKLDDPDQLVDLTDCASWAMDDPGFFTRVHWHISALLARFRSDTSSGQNRSALP
jgi:hypothetical protein